MVNMLITGWIVSINILIMKYEAIRDENIDALV